MFWGLAVTELADVVSAVIGLKVVGSAIRSSINFFLFDDGGFYRWRRRWQLALLLLEVVLFLLVVVAVAEDCKHINVEPNMHLYD